MAQRATRDPEAEVKGDDGLMLDEQEIAGNYEAEVAEEVEKGVYPAVSVKFEKKDAQTGTPGFFLLWRILSLPGTPTVPQNIYVSPAAMQIASRQFRAMGVPIVEGEDKKKRFQINKNTMLGVYAMVEITYRKYEGEDRINVMVKSSMPPDMKAKFSHTPPEG